VTLPPIDCWMCKTKNSWHSVDDHINHIETAFIHTSISCNEPYTHYWHPILHLYVFSFASRSFVTSQFLINCYPRYLSEIWRGILHSCPLAGNLRHVDHIPIFLVHMARLPDLSSSSSFSWISMMHHKQFQIFQPCARGLCGELCSWIHGWMLHDSRHSGRFFMSTDRSFYDTYEITHVNLVSISHH